MPQFMNGTSENILYLNKERFSIKTNMKVACDIISENIKHYTNVIFPPKIYTSTSLKKTLGNNLIQLNIDIKESDVCPGYPDSKMDESCKFNRLFNRLNFIKNKPVIIFRQIENIWQLCFYQSCKRLGRFERLRNFFSVNLL